MQNSIREETEKTEREMERKGTNEEFATGTKQKQIHPSTLRQRPTFSNTGTSTENQQP